MRRAKQVDRDVAKLSSMPMELVSLSLTDRVTKKLINEAGVAFKKVLIETSLNVQLSHHLGYEPGAERSDPGTNHRNSSTAKTVLTRDGKLQHRSLKHLYGDCIIDTNDRMW